MLVNLTSESFELGKGYSDGLDMWLGPILYNAETQVSNRHHMHWSQYFFI